MVKSNPSNKINPNWILLALMISVYLGLSIFNKELVSQAIQLTWEMLLKIIPVLALVYVFIFIINYFVEPKKIKKHLGREAGIKGLALSIIAGILSIGPIYSWYPLLADLHNHGMSNNLIAVFLYNRAIKIPLLIMLIYYFGVTFTITVTTLIIIFSIINGKLVEAVLPSEIKRKE